MKLNPSFWIVYSFLISLNLGLEEILDLSTSGFVPGRTHGLMRTAAAQSGSQITSY
jgi:hypothetical protein